MTETIKTIEELTGKPFDELWKQESINLGSWVKAEKYHALQTELATLRQLLREVVEWLIKLTKGVGEIDTELGITEIYCSLCGNTKYHYDDCSINEVLIDITSLINKIKKIRRK